VAGRNPVILLHGLGDTSALFDRLCAYLERRGWVTHRLNLTPRWGGAGLEELARQVASYVDMKLGTEATFDLVGFSMGGIVARYYLQRLGGLNRVSRLVTIASPHRGTLMAFLLRSPGVRQLRPGSGFLRELNEDSHVLKRLHFTTIWTPWDLMILPAKSSVIPEAREVRIGVMAHALMVRDRRALRAVELALSE
jgi:triacylglycerol lipase